MARSLHSLLVAQSKARTRRMQRASKALLKLVTPPARRKSARPPKPLKPTKPAKPGRNSISPPTTLLQFVPDLRNASQRPAKSFLSGLGSRADDGAGVWRNFLYTPPHGAPAGATQLSYAVYLPPGLPAQGAPVMVVLHGCQQDMHAIARGTRFNMLADSKGFAVIYIQQAVRNNSSGCWRWFSAHGEQEADMIASITMRTVASHGLDAGRVYMAGMSAGAGMAALVALRHPTLVSAVAMHSGTVVGEATSVQAGMRVMRRGTTQPLARLLAPYLHGIAAVGAMPAIILHGDTDRVVAPKNAAQLASQFLYLNRVDPATGRTTVLAKGTKNEYSRTDYGPDKSPVVRVCLVRQLEHAWSGGNGDIRFHASIGPDAAALIWRFFSGHRRRSAGL